MGEPVRPADVPTRPKIDLHRHLLGSARPATLWDLARGHGGPAGALPFDKFQAEVVHLSRPRTLEGYIRPWQVFRDVIQTDDDVRRIAAEAAEDALRDGVVYVEFRGSLPGMPVTDGTAPQTRIPTLRYLRAVRDGFAAVPGITCRLVASVPRHAFGRAGPADFHRYADRFAAVAADFKGDPVVGIDLTGIEHGFPARWFRDVFRVAREVGLKATVHAGETEGPEEIWSALDDLGADRIGHGTAAPRDKGLVRELIDRNIVLEVCPTAGWLVGVVPDQDRHPVLDAGRRPPFVICTDNPTLNRGTDDPSLNRGTLSQELRLAADILKEDLGPFLDAQYRAAAAAAFGPVPRPDGPATS